MATGQPGFGDSLFKLAGQRQAALSAEQARVTNQENIRRRDIDKLSGFNASLIEGDQQRSIFEDAVADVQSYIAGTGQYEDSEYDPVNFRAHVAKITSLYNGFKGHNEGDVNVAQQSLYDDAYTEGGQEIGRENGIIQKSNNTPTSYDEAVASHNNYFESYTVDGKVQYDENGHPMGFPIIDGVVDRSKPASSIFKMDAYSNPENFKGNTVDQPIPSLYDMSVTAQTEIQNKQNIVGPNGLQTLQEVSDLHFDNAVNDFNFLEGAIRDVNRNGDNIEITDEQLRAYAAGEGDPEFNKILENYKAEAKKEWSKLTAYGRTGSGSDSPFTGNTFEHTLSVTTGEDLDGMPTPQEDSVSNVGLNITPIEVTSSDHGNYQITGIIGAAIGGGAEGGGEGMYVMIPQEVEMLKLPNGSIIPMGQATEDQLTALGGGHAGYSTIDVTDNEMVRIDGDNADPRSREILDNLNSHGITERDFQINTMQNQERFLEVKAEREAQAAAQAEIDAANADVPPEETTEVGTGEPLPDDPAAVARDNAMALAAAADLLENDSDATPEEKEAARARAEEARIEAEAVADGIAEEDIATADAELDASEASQAQSEENVAATNARIQAERNRSVGGLLRNLVSLGPTAAYNLYQAGEEQEAADIMEEENTGQGEAQTKMRERLLAEEARMIEEERVATEKAEIAERDRIAALPENVATAANERAMKGNEAITSIEASLDGKNLWESAYANPDNASVSGVLDPMGSNYTSELAAAVKRYGEPPEGSPHRAAYDLLVESGALPGVIPESEVETNRVIADAVEIVEATDVSEMPDEIAAELEAEADTAIGTAHQAAMGIITKLGGVEYGGSENVKEVNDQVKKVLEHIMPGYTDKGGSWDKAVEGYKQQALANYVVKQHPKFKGVKYKDLTKSQKKKYDKIKAEGETIMAGAKPGSAGGVLSYEVAPHWCAAWVSSVILNKNPNYNLNAELAEGMPSGGAGKTDKFDRLRAKAFQTIGETIFNSANGVGSLDNAQIGDVITRVNSSGGNHVGFYAGMDEDGNVLFLGGNQNDSVNVMPFSASSVQSINRIQLSGEPTITGRETKESFLTQEEIEAISSLTSVSSGSDR